MRTGVWGACEPRTTLVAVRVELQKAGHATCLPLPFPSPIFKISHIPVVGSHDFLKFKVNVSEHLISLDHQIPRTGVGFKWS